LKAYEEEQSTNSSIKSTLVYYKEEMNTEKERNAHFQIQVEDLKRKLAEA
jgi:hypothetical protein